MSGNVPEILMILASLCSLTSGTVLLDEPELSLHPTKRNILRRAIYSLCGIRSIIIVTHASEMLEEDTYNYTYRCHISGQATSTYSLNKIKDDVKLLTLEPQFKSFLFSDRAFLVEGKTETRVLSIFYNMLDNDAEFEKLLKKKHFNP